MKNMSKQKNIETATTELRHSSGVLTVANIVFTSDYSEDLRRVLRI